MKLTKTETRMLFVCGRYETRQWSWSDIESALRQGAMPPVLERSLFLRTARSLLNKGLVVGDEQGSGVLTEKGLGLFHTLRDATPAKNLEGLTFAQWLRMAGRRVDPENLRVYTQAWEGCDDPAKYQYRQKRDAAAE